MLLKLFSLFETLLGFGFLTLPSPFASDSLISSMGPIFYWSVVIILFAPRLLMLPPPTVPRNLKIWDVDYLNAEGFLSRPLIALPRRELSFYFKREGNKIGCYFSFECRVGAVYIYAVVYVLPLTYDLRLLKFNPLCIQMGFLLSGWCRRDFRILLLHWHLIIDLLNSIQRWLDIFTTPLKRAFVLFVL